MTMDELMQAILAIAPDALFDEEYGTGEIMVSTGFRVIDGQVVPLSIS
jgi:hypothetical protein